MYPLTQWFQFQKFVLQIYPHTCKTTQYLFFYKTGIVFLLQFVYYKKQYNIFLIKRRLVKEIMIYPGNEIVSQHLGLILLHAAEICLLWSQQIRSFFSQIIVPEVGGSRAWWSRYDGSTQSPSPLMLDHPSMSFLRHAYKMAAMHSDLTATFQAGRRRRKDKKAVPF